ncbi:hypothetical protein IscW_ISCW008964, partial [Ixodes scapularis]
APPYPPPPLHTGRFMASQIASNMDPDRHHKKLQLRVQAINKITDKTAEDQRVLY